MASNNDPGNMKGRLNRDKDSKALSPDTEDHVRQQTEDVFRSFMSQRYQQDLARSDAEQIEQTPSLPEVTRYNSNPMSQEVEIGRQLAMVGDDINERYRKTFDEMIVALKISPDTAYEAFAGIARRLFSDGSITWGRIITLLCFGYRMALNVLSKGIRGFFSKIITFVAKFIFQERIAAWIAEQGGWIASLNYVRETVGWDVIFMIGAIAAGCLVMAFWLSKR